MSVANQERSETREKTLTTKKTMHIKGDADPLPPFTPVKDLKASAGEPKPMVKILVE